MYKTWTSLISLKDEKVRLSTFFEWDNPHVNPVDLAQNGMYFLREKDFTQCIECRIIIGDWASGDIVKQEHATIAPYCPLVTGRIDRDMDLIRDFDLQRYPLPAKYPTVPQRYATFSGWPLPEISTMKLAQANFAYCHVSDHVMCVTGSCGIRNWRKGEDPMTLHRTLFPECAFVQLQASLPKPKLDNSAHRLCKVC